MKQLIIILLLLSLSACTQDFEATNTNENAPSVVNPALLLRQSLYGYGDAMGYESFVAGNLLSQHLAMIDFNLFDRHALASPQEGGNPWDIFYVNLRDVQTVLDLSTSSPVAAVYEGPARIMKAYFAMQLTDLYGDVPYSEAFKGRSGNVNPVYDTQQSIYLDEDGILDNLRAARQAISSYAGVQSLEGDILYDGDLAKWEQFARSLELKALIRIAGQEDVVNTITDLIASGTLITSNADNASFNFTDGQPNNYPIANTRIGIFNVFLMSNTAEAIFMALDDPRVNTLYRPAANSGEFNGIANGINAASAIVPDDFARPGTVWRENTGDLDFSYLNAWEVQFLLAEYALLNESVEASEAYYEEGVRLAFEYWNTALPEDYLTEGPTAFDVDHALEQIITQKWIANMSNTYEGWTEWRRTAFPVLSPAEASLNNGLYPVRMPYPADEQALNFDNYQSAAASTDGNSINFKVWWDVD